jgi:hypothetical protein
VVKTTENKNIGPVAFSVQIFDDDFQIRLLILNFTFKGSLPDSVIAIFFSKKTVLHFSEFTVQVQHVLVNPNKPPGRHVCPGH